MRILFENSLRLGTVRTPLQIFLIQVGDNPQEIFLLLPVYLPDQAILQNRQLRYRAKAHPELPGGGKLQEPGIKKLKPRPKSRGVPYLLRQR
jgi:hypothetical protein